MDRTADEGPLIEQDALPSQPQGFAGGLDLQTAEPGTPRARPIRVLPYGNKTVVFEAYFSL